MFFKDVLKHSIIALTSNKLRSFLTILSIILATSSVITVLTIKNSTNLYVASEFQKLGSNSIAIQSLKNSQNIKESLITKDDIKDLKSLIPKIEHVQCINQYSSYVIFNNKKLHANIYGIEPEYKLFSTINILDGRFFTAADEKFSNNVIIISDTLAKKLFTSLKCINRSVEISNLYGTIDTFNIIGIYENQLISDTIIRNEAYPENIFLPLTSSQKLFNSDNLDIVQISVDGDISELRNISKTVIKALELKHNTKNSFISSNSLDAQKQYMNIIDLISTICIVICIITLIIGSIGIINILLISVKERYHEIGILKSIGAKNSSIVISFITESILLTLSGGIIGIFLGYCCGHYISSLLTIPFIYDIKIMIISIIVTIFLGMLFGVYPAYKAAKLEPVSILHRE